MIKRKGGKGYPCLKPLCNSNLGVGDPLTRIEDQAGITYAWIHDQYFHQRS